MKTKLAKNVLMVIKFHLLAPDMKITTIIFLFKQMRGYNNMTIYMLIRTCQSYVLATHKNSKFFKKKFCIKSHQYTCMSSVYIVYNKPKPPAWASIRDIAT